MPTFRQLNAEELAQMRARRGPSVDLTEYSQFLQGLNDGEGGELVLGPNEQKRTVKRRLTTAAKRMGKEVRYRRTEGNHLRFEIRG